MLSFYDYTELVFTREHSITADLGIVIHPSTNYFWGKKYFVNITFPKNHQNYYFQHLKKRNGETPENI